MKLPFQLDDGTAATAAFGIIVLQNDETLEAELRRVFDHPGLALYHTRIASAAEVTAETLKQMEAGLPRAAALLPRARPLDVVAYACTSGATVIGTDKVAAALGALHPEAAITDPITATIAACAELGARRLGFVSPYVAEVSRAMRALLERQGLVVAAFGSFEQGDEAVVARIEPASVREAICQVGRNGAVDAVFASCTNLRSFDVIERAEAEIGKPVVTSNQALAWHMLRLAGVPTRARGPGRLFQT